MKTPIKKPKRCIECGKMLRHQNNSGFCQFHWKRNYCRRMALLKKLSSLGNSHKSI